MTDPHDPAAMTAAAQRFADLMKNAPAPIAVGREHDTEGMSSMQDQSNHLPAEHEAYSRGVEAARATATWIADGNTKTEAIRYVLELFEAGDPAVDDYLPRCPDLSGEYADDPTPLSLAREILGEDDPDPAAIASLAEAFEEGVSDTFYDACEAELRRWLGDES